MAGRSATTEALPFLLETPTTPPDRLSAGPAAHRCEARRCMRYAILFAGVPARRHLNGLEFSYRTLVDHYGFEPAHIHVLTHDSSLRAAGEPLTCEHPLWPGDNTPYRMKASGEGNRAALRGVLGEIKEKLTEDDLLFINTTGHGGNYGDGRGPYLIAYPHLDQYTMSEFCEDLGRLPLHGSLLVLMAQCFSGGFNKAVIAASRAKRTFIAAAAADSHRSFVVAADKSWDSFQRNWIGAVAGHDVNGLPLPGLAASTDGGRINVRAAFEYANDPLIRNPRDTPEFASSSEAAERMTLDAA
jgi:hypothetical protein